jgi:large subunit ribosomal protein L30
MKSFNIKLVRSVIGCSKDQRETVRCLGLKKIGQVVSIKDNPANRGQIYKVQHLVSVTVQG